MFSTPPEGCRHRRSSSPGDFASLDSGIFFHSLDSNPHFRVYFSQAADESEEKNGSLL